MFNIEFIPASDFQSPADLSQKALLSLKALTEVGVQGGEHTPQSLYQAVAAGQLGVLCIIEVLESGREALVGAVGYQVTDYPAARVVTVTLVNGTEVERWLDKLVQHMDEGCRRMGASRLEVVGRPGWAKLLAPYSSETAVVMTREVPNGEGTEDHSNAESDEQQLQHESGLAAGDVGHREHGDTGLDGLGASASGLYRT